MCDSKPLTLSPASKTIWEYDYEIIKDVFNYQMRREAAMQEVHKFFTDDRNLEGLKIYKEGKIKNGAVTNVDVRATVEGSKGKEYTVILKKWQPLEKDDTIKLIRHRYEVEEYFADMFFDCSCQDHLIHHYKGNSSICCKHIAAVMWMLMEEYNMRKFFIKPEEVGGYQKSNNIDLVKNLKCLPMKKFTPYINIVALREFRAIQTSLSVSIHRNPNKGYEDNYPNGIATIWATITEPNEVEKLIKALIRGYVEMLVSRKNQHEQIVEAVKSLAPTNGEEKEIKRLQNIIKEKDKKILEMEEGTKLTLFQRIKRKWKHL